MPPEQCTKMWHAVIMYGILENAGWYFPVGNVLRMVIWESRLFGDMCGQTKKWTCRELYYYIYNSNIVEYLIIYGLQLLKANKTYWDFITISYQSRLKETEKLKEKVSFEDLSLF